MFEEQQEVKVCRGAGAGLAEREAGPGGGGMRRRGRAVSGGEL